MNEIEYAIRRARNEYRNNDNVLSTSTVMELSTLGLIVPDLEAEFEKEIDNG